MSRAHVPDHPDAVAPTLGGASIALLILLCLTAATTGLAFVALPPWAHLGIGLTIAAIKAGVVIVVFMHLCGEGRLIRVAAALGGLFLAILLLFVLVDVAARAPRERSTTPGLESEPR